MAALIVNGRRKQRQVTDKYLLAGISALARAKGEFDYPWFFGHSGASVLAGYFLLRDNDLATDVRSVIEEHLDQLISADEALFKAFSFDACQADKQELMQCLSECVRTHSTTGHGVIFGTLALKAFTIEPALLTNEVSDGVVALLRDCLEDVPNRHYGISEYRSPAVDYSGIKLLRSAKEAADYSLTVHDTVYPDQIIENTYYFLAGDLLHCVTYAHALLELEELGYGDIVEAGLEAISRHIYLSSRTHRELEPIKATRAYDPTTLAFWNRSITEPHHIKLAYSSLALTASKSAEERSRVFGDLSKYWASYQ